MKQPESSNHGNNLETNQKSGKDFLLKLFENIEMEICVMCLFAMTVITFAQVIGRYVFNYSFSWSEEVSRFLLAWITFGGASYAFKFGAHIGVTYFIDKLPSNARKNVYVLIQAIVVFFFVVFGIYGLSHTMGAVQLKQIAPATRISIGIPYAAIPVGCLLVVIRTIIDTVNKVKTYNWEVKEQ